MMGGRFITFEGGEGGGKTTQIQYLGKALQDVGIDVVSTREPGGTLAAEEIRQLLVAGSPNRWLPKTELLLHCSARVEHINHVIEPALRSGRWVISDRFHDSTAAYQGYGLGLGLELVDTLHNLLHGNFRPDLTLILDAPIELGLQRTKRRKGSDDRYEQMDITFHERLRSGFLDIAKKEPSRCVVIDASKDEEAVFKQVKDAINNRLALALDRRLNS